MPPAHTTVRVRISEPSESTTRSGSMPSTVTPSRSFTPAFSRTFEAYSCALSENGAEHDLGRVDEVDLGAADVEVVVAPRA